MGIDAEAIDHVVIAVNDLDAAVATFGDTYGLRMSRRGENAGLGIANAFFPLGDSEIELVTPLGDDDRNPVRRRLQDGEGLFLLSLRVPDVDAAVAGLREQGSTVTDPSEGDPRLAFVSPKHAHGVHLQLIQRG